MSNELEVKYETLKKQFLTLQSHYNELLDAYHHILSANKDQLYKINELTIENNMLRSRLQDSTDNLSYFAKTVCPPFYQTPSQSVTLNDISMDGFESVGNDQACSSLVEAFLVLGPGGKNTPEILWEFSHAEIPQSIRSVLPDFCFPQGVYARRLKLTGSETELNSLLYGQVPIRRDKNCFLFTLRRSEVAYNDLIYAFCVLTEDLTKDDLIVPKVYCLLTSLPIFELHFELICSILQLKRLDRMELLQSDKEVPELETPRDTFELLEEFFKEYLIMPGEKIKVGVPRIDPILFSCPDDLSEMGVAWTCCPLLSSLEFQDLFWLVCAFLQERSIVFVSHNIGLVSSCVLGLLALIRPFKWPHTCIPILPENFNTYLDAPVPLLAGIYPENDNNRRKGSSIIWVDLDEEFPDMRIKGPLDVVKQIEELHAKDLKNMLRKLFAYHRDESGFTPTPERVSAVLQFVKCFNEYWNNIIDVAPADLAKKAYKNIAKNLKINDERKFLKNLCSTQLFEIQINNKS